MKPKEVTLITYSRDELAGPLRDLDKVLLAVRLGVFIPDSTRSGRSTQDSAAKATLDEVFPEVSTPCISADDTISSSSKSSSSASECVDTDDASSGEDSLIVAVSEDMAGVTAPMKLQELPGAGLARNLANGFLHGVRNANTLLCGSALPKRSLILSAWPKRSFPLCRDCSR